jgi:hypothetical protein
VEELIDRACDGDFDSEGAVAIGHDTKALRVDPQIAVRWPTGWSSIFRGEFR